MSRRDAAAAPETEYGENEYMGREAGPSAIQRAFIYLGRFVLILMETVLLRGGLTALPAAAGAMVFGLLLYLAALQAMGVGSGRSDGLT